MAGTEKSITIKIPNNELIKLKENHYRLCLAKKVNDTYNVVWTSNVDYLSHNNFSWTPHFQLFGTNTFEDNVKVVAQTNQRNIWLGQQATLNKAGVIGEVSTGGPSTGLTLHNNYGAIHPGVNQVLTVDGEQRTNSIYVAEDQIVSGSTTLTPKEIVMVWFQQDVETGTMFSTSRSNSTEIDLTKSNSETREYINGGWITPSQEALAETAAQLAGGAGLLRIALATTGSVAATTLATKIGTYLTGVYSDINVDVQAGENRRLTVTYKERSDLEWQQRVFLRSLIDSSESTLNQLTTITMKAMSDLGTGYTVLEANRL